MRDRSARHAGPPARRGQEPVTSASTTPGAAGEWRRRLDARRRGSMALTRKGTEARDALSAAALRRAAEEDAPKGGRCLQCRPGGRYFKYRPPLGLVRSVRCDVCLLVRSRSKRCRGASSLSGAHGVAAACRWPRCAVARNTGEAAACSLRRRWRPQPDMFIETPHQTGRRGLVLLPVPRGARTGRAA